MPDTSRARVMREESPESPDRADLQARTRLGCGLGRQRNAHSTTVAPTWQERRRSTSPVGSRPTVDNGPSKAASRRRRGPFVDRETTIDHVEHHEPDFGPWLSTRSRQAPTRRPHGARPPEESTDPGRLTTGVVGLVLVRRAVGRPAPRGLISRRACSGSSRCSRRACRWSGGRGPRPPCRSSSRWR